MNVLSLFGGVETGLIALKELNIKVDNYYSSEIDKYAVSVAKYNHPEIIELGNIENYKSWELPKIDLVMAGFPCQSFSFAGKQLNFDDPRGQLFFKAVELLWDIQKVNPGVKFLFENVKMKKEFQNAISEILERGPVLINSALLSAQNRQRLYWCNWEPEQPQDKGILLKDIIENDFVDRDKSHCLDANYFKGGNLKSYFEKNRRQLVFELREKNDRVKDVSITNDGIRPHRGDIRKSGISELGRIMFSDAKKTYTVISSHVPKIIEFKKNYAQYDMKGKGHKSQGQRAFYKNGKHGTIPSSGTGKIMINKIPFAYRKLTTIEWERLQTLPDNYTQKGIDNKGNVANISNAQRYKMIGNGWTKDVIKHILKSIN